jgi:phasin family protein
MNENNMVPTTLRETAAKMAPAFGPQAVTQRLNSMIDNTRGLMAFGKANFEAATASGKIWVAGVQDLTNQLAGTARASFDGSVANAKALRAAKSVREAIDLQGAHGKASLANTMAESKRLTEASLKLAEQSMAPLTARIAVAAESFAKAA